MYLPAVAITGKHRKNNNISLEIYGISIASRKNTKGNIITKNIMENTVRINTIGVPLDMGTP